MKLMKINEEPKFIFINDAKIEAKFHCVIKTRNIFLFRETICENSLKMRILKIIKLDVKIHEVFVRFSDNFDNEYSISLQLNFSN